MIKQERKEKRMGKCKVFFNDDSLTQQHFRKSTNINDIISKYHKTGVLPVQSMRPKNFGDFTGVVDYMDAMIRVKRVNEEFRSLPSKVRKRFENNPAELIAFLEKEGNRQEAIELGLIEEPDKRLKIGDSKEQEEKVPEKEVPDGKEGKDVSK